MKTIAQISGFVFFIALVVTVVVLGVIFQLESQQVGVDRVQYYKLYFDAIKAIWISFVVALLVALIPQGIAEVRYRFERLKESRKAYSETKTGVDYLSIRVSTLPLKEAVAHVQKIHVWKHQAELYEELDQHLKRRGDNKTSKQWGDEMYDKLSHIRTLLENHSADWDAKKPHERLRLLSVGQFSDGKISDGGPKDKTQTA